MIRAACATAGEASRLVTAVVGAMRIGGELLRRLEDKCRSQDKATSEDVCGVTIGAVKLRPPTRSG